MGLKWLVFLIGPMYLIGMWLSEDQRANIIKTCLKEITLRLQILTTTLHTIVYTIGKSYVSNQEISKHALPKTITNQGISDSQSSFCICFIIDLLCNRSFFV